MKRVRVGQQRERERERERDSRVRCELWREQGKGGKDMKTDGLLEV